MQLRLPGLAAATFHPLLNQWFAATFPNGATEIQQRGWQHIAGGADTLIAAPTGSGKTLAAFLWALNRLAEAASSGTLEDRVYVIYVSPLKALGNDIEKNLRVPLAGVQELSAAEGRPFAPIRVAVRSGDTPASERQGQLRRPPHILITTPESLYILLTAEKSRRMLSAAETVIVDEIHALAADKRGSHLSLSLERLDALTKTSLQRIGLSATQRPIEDIARLLVGAARCDGDGTARCAVVDAGHRREIDLRVETTDIELGPMPTHEMRDLVYERIVALTREHRTTIVFVNTRRLVERVAHALSERLGKDRVAAHHGSMSRESRLAAEGGLKSGAVPVVVATASLELGIDVGHVDLVVHLGAPRSLASLLQRIGRSGHWLGAVPKGIIFPLTRDELVQSAAAVRAAYAGELDRICIPENSRDILAQQMVAAVASEDMGVEELWDLVRRSHSYRNLERAEFDAVLEMLTEGVSTRRGRRSAHLHHDRVHGRLHARRGARLAAITSGGAIPDTADYDVVEDATGGFVGKVNEDFAIESMAGDIFLLGNRSWRIRRVEAGRMRVVDADGAPPTIPFWLGESPGRTRELSRAVGDLRLEVAARHRDPAAAIEWLTTEARVDAWGAAQIVQYVAEAMAVLGAVPTPETLIAERFFDEAGGMQLVLHAPFGSRINRAFGLALRKRFCVSFDFELQAAATDDGIVLSLGEQHSFPLDGVVSMIRRSTVEDDLTQAALVAPMFTNRWRWNSSRALVLPRFTGGRKVPMPIQRMRADDLLAAVFPAQVACGDNRTGPIEAPDHPLVNETIDNCLYEAMDTEGLKEVLAAIDSGAIRTLAVETPAPSPLSHEILNANPYAFLDDAPLEERRARAVSLRRTDPDLASGIGALDADAIAEVRRHAWPDARDADEVHDALLNLVLLPEIDAEPWRQHLETLVAARRAVPVNVKAQIGDGRARITTPGDSEELDAQRDPQGDDDEGMNPSPRLLRSEISDLRSCYVATERLPWLGALLPSAPPFTVPAAIAALPVPDDPAVEAVRGWMECIGPTTASALSQRLGLSRATIDSALARLEADGCILQGHFEATLDGEVEWCERTLLARIHRLTLGRLRREIEAVSPADFMRFLFRWQHVLPGTQLHGRAGVRAIIGQLQGLELPGPAWERDVLPARIESYDPADLEQVCLAGEVAWGRLAVALPSEDEDGEVRRRGAPTRSAPLAFVLREHLPELLEPLPENPTGVVAAGFSPRARQGAPGTVTARRNRSSPGALKGAATMHADGPTVAPALVAGPGADPLPRDAAEGQGEGRYETALSPIALEIFDYLERRGARFQIDIARDLSRLPTEVEEALWELVACGLVTGDGVAGLRSLLSPERRESRAGHLRSLPGRGARRLMPVGRWALLRGSEAEPLPPAEIVERAARRLLERYGVVFREICARERRAPRWRDLLHTYRRLEARGEVRGGRFVQSFVGEQFALPEAVDAMRATRRQREPDSTVLIAAADPLNLVGIITPGARVSPFSGQVIAYRDGVPVEIGELGTVRTSLANQKLGESGSA